MRCYVLMGVSGCGKTSVGEALAARTDVTFVDGDALHPQSNIDKMASGQPLDDTDRAPWLRQVGDTLEQTPGPVAIGCSALKRAYRDIIRNRVSDPVGFLHLDASRDVLQVRVNQRSGHFMPRALLDSQFEALEPLGPDEDGVRIDIDRPFEAVVDHTVTYVRETST